MRMLDEGSGLATATASRRVKWVLKTERDVRLVIVKFRVL